MEKLTFKKNEAKPEATKCKRCEGSAEPKHLDVIGWRQQEYCETCAPLVDDESKQLKLEEDRTVRVTKLIEESNIMRGILANMTFKTFNEDRENKKMLEIATKYAMDFGPETKRGLMISGGAGIGKTHLSVAIARYLIEEKGVDVLFVRTVDILQEIRRTYDENELRRTETESDLIAKYSRSSLLILDDMGAEKITDWVRQILYHIIDERWILSKPTIITTNLSLGDIEKRVDERLASRIAALCEVWQFKGEDKRLK